MTTGTGEGPERRGWRDRLPQDPALMVGMAIPVLLALMGAMLLIYGAGQDSTHTMSNGGDWLFFAALLAGPMKVGWWLKGRQRKMRVEQKLDVVQEGLDRVEELLSNAVPGNDNVVRPLRRRLMLYSLP